MVGMEEYMRKIKFRGWYIGPLVNRMLSPEFHGPINEIFNDPENEGHVVYMQYTGLKDTNGKEIYEGDIVSVHDEEEPLLVKFIEERAAFVLYNAFKYHHWNFDEYKSFEIEIIGNKFENPEILGEFGK